jgi:RES domain-containing protein
LTITAWRIFKRKHAATVFSGAGARRFGGRWNSKGVAVIYAAGSPSLAALEMLVHLESQELLGAYRVASVSFDEALVEALPAAKLPARWRRDPAPARLQRLGDAWVAAGSSAVLRVPSVIIADEWNYLLNPNHPDFAKCVLGAAKAFHSDERLLK